MENNYQEKKKKILREVENRTIKANKIKWK